MWLKAIVGVKFQKTRRTGVADIFLVARGVGVRVGLVGKVIRLGSWVRNIVAGERCDFFLFFSLYCSFLGFR